MGKTIFTKVILLQVILLLILSVEPTSAQAGSTVNERLTAAPPVYSQGQVSIDGTWSCDLDLGIQTLSSSLELTRDFYWELDTNVKRYLAPRNGAKFHVIGIVDFNSIGYSQLRGYTYSTDSINGSNDATNQIPAGTVVAAITNEGRYGKFRVDIYGDPLTITWLTYDNYRIRLPIILR